MAVGLLERLLGAERSATSPAARGWRARARDWPAAGCIEGLQLAGLLRLQGGIGLGELRVGLGQAAVELAQLATLAVQLDQHRDLAAQDLRHHRHRHVVDRAELVALQPIQLGHVHAGDEDDRRALEARMLVDQRRGLEAVHVRHADVEQHHRELLLHQLARAPPGPSAP